MSVKNLVLNVSYGNFLKDFLSELDIVPISCNMAKYREIFVGWWITGPLVEKAYVTYSISF